MTGTRQKNTQCSMKRSQWPNPGQFKHQIMIATNYNPLSKTVTNSTLILTCKILTNYKEKKGNFTMEKSGRHQLNQVNK